mgnify:CR=1 FL=1
MCPALTGPSGSEIILVASLKLWLNVCTVLETRAQEKRKDEINAKVHHKTISMEGDYPLQRHNP